MTSDIPSIVVSSKNNLGRLGLTGEYVLLCASVPYERDFPKDVVKKESDYINIEDQYYRAIRSAVLWLARYTFGRKKGIVFGAHPSISPMLLTVARDMGVDPKSVVIFQTEFFRNQLPNSTIELASWDAGLLVWTPAKKRTSRPARLSKKARSPAYWRDKCESLKVMRTIMADIQELVAVVFIGGMSGVLEEAEIIRSARNNLPRYALASTGSAARSLFEESSERYSGSLLDPGILESCRSYPSVMQAILDDVDDKKS